MDSIKCPINASWVLVLKLVEVDLVSDKIFGVMTDYVTW
jgi:hypothetical protein